MYVEYRVLKSLKRGLISDLSFSCQDTIALHLLVVYCLRAFLVRIPEIFVHQNERLEALKLTVTTTGPVFFCEQLMVNCWFGLGF